MGLVADSKATAKMVLTILAILMILIVPWSSFITLPDFLWFLENNTLANYLFNQHYQLFIYLLTIIGVFLIPYVIYKAK